MVFSLMVGNPISPWSIGNKYFIFVMNESHPFSKKKAAKLLNVSELDRDAFDVTNRNSRPSTEFTLGNPAIGLAVRIDLCRVLVHIWIQSEKKSLMIRRRWTNETVVLNHICKPTRGKHPISLDIYVGNQTTPELTILNSISEHLWFLLFW